MLQQATRQRLTVLFCDIVGSTPLSIRLAPEQYYEILRQYYEVAAQVIARHGGFVRQHLGDGIYAYFGYPNRQTDDAVRAVRAGLDLVIAMRGLSRRIESTANEQIHVRVGINSGRVVLGAAGEDTFPLAFGETANIAAKLQSLADPDSVVVSDATARLVGGALKSHPVGSLQTVLGRQPIEALAVDSIASDQAASLAPAAPQVGRLVETEQLVTLWNDLVGRPARTITSAIFGPPGIGKSRLVRELQAHVPPEQWCEARVDTSRAHLPARPFIDLGRRLAGIEPDDPLAKQLTLAEDYLESLGIAPEPSMASAFIGASTPADASQLQLDPAAHHAKVVGWTINWLAALSAVRPIVLVVEDVDQADPTTLALLGAFALGPAPILLVLTAREPACLDRFALTSRIHLQPLSSEDARSLIRSVGGPLEDDDRLDQILRLGDGIPFYLEQLAPLWVKPLESIELELDNVVEGRLLGTGAAPLVVAAAAALGPTFSAADVAAAAELPVEDVTQQLSALAASGVCDSVGPGRMRFRHELMRDTALQLVLEETLAAIHSRIADLLPSDAIVSDGAPTSVRAHHLAKAGRVYDALDSYLSTAVRMQALGAHRETVQLLSQAVALLDAIPDMTVRAVYELSVRPLRGLSAMSAEGYASADAQRDYEACLALCRLAGARPELLPLLTGMWAYYMSRGEIATSETIARQLREVIDLEHDGFVPENESAFGVLAYFKGEYEVAAHHLAPMLDVQADSALATRIAQSWSLPNDPLTAGLVHLAVVLWVTGHPHEAFEAGNRAIRRAASMPFPMGPFSLAYAKTYVGHLHRVRQDGEQADRLAREVMALGERHGFGFWQLTGALQLAIGAAEAGDAAACRDLEVTAGLWAGLGARVFLPYYYAELGRTHLAGGRIDEGLAANAQSLAIADATGANFFRAETLRGRALLTRAAGDERGSGALFEESIAVAERQGAVVFGLRAALSMRASADSTVAATGRDLVERIVTRFPPGVGYPELSLARSGS